MPPPPATSQRPSPLKARGQAAACTVAPPSGRPRAHVPELEPAGGRSWSRAIRPSGETDRPVGARGRRATRPPGRGDRPSKSWTKPLASRWRAAGARPDAAAARAAPTGPEGALQPPRAVKVPCDHGAVAAGAVGGPAVARWPRPSRPRPRAASVSIGAERRCVPTIRRSSPRRHEPAAVGAEAHLVTAPSWRLGPSMAAGAEVEQAHLPVPRSEGDQPAAGRLRAESATGYRRRAQAGRRRG